MPFTSTTRDVSDAHRSVLRRIVVFALLAVWATAAYWHTHKPLPVGVRVESPGYPEAPGDISFIADITSADAYGRPVISQAIFDEVLTTVRSARKLVVLDYFLFGSEESARRDGAPPSRKISQELRDALLAQLHLQRGLRVVFITDPATVMYGERPSADLQQLHDAGADIVITDLAHLRDSNFIYSSLWRLTMGWWSGGESGAWSGRSTAADAGAGANAGQEGWLPNPLAESDTPIGLRTFARLLNFKSDHRNVVIADDGRGGLVAIVGSASPYDLSTVHSNAAVKITGRAVQPLLASELAIARFSGWKGTLDPPPIGPDENMTGQPASTAQVRVLTEGAIRKTLLERLEASARGDRIDIAMFYLSDHGVVEALLAASRRGAVVRLILDPNKDAFGHPQAGIPNQPVASELVAASDGAIHVRWYRTHGEEFHTKLVLIYSAQRLWLSVGSANLTRRDLLDYDLEANIAVEVERASPLATEVVEYFETLWSNRASLGIEYTADFGFYADPSQLHYWLYRVMEGTGASRF